MNIKIQCCAIVLVALIAILYEQRGKLNLRASKVFKGSLYASLVCLMLDVLSLVGIYYRADLPEFWSWLPEFVCKTYLVSLLSVGLLAQVYIATTVAAHLKYYKKLIALSIALTSIVAILVYALPITIGESADKSLAWTEGPACFATYGGMLALIIANIVQMVLRHKYINNRQLWTVSIWMVLWIVSATVQIFISQLLIVGFAGALGVALVYFQFENPELNLDRTTGLFNYTAFTRYGEQLYGSNKKFYVMAVSFDAFSWKSGSQIESGASVRDIFNVFLKIEGATAFRIMESEVLLVFNREENLNKAWADLKTKGYHAMFYMEDARCVSSHRELLKLMRYYSFQKRDGMPGSCYIIGSDVIEQMQAERAMVKEIVAALEEDRVVVYYQPIFSVEAKRFTTAEALVRIVDREGKLIPPGAFIGIAESNGMIVEIGKRVFEKVCRFFVAEKLEEYGMEYVEVNLSVVQCDDNNLADDYIKIMDGTGMKPACINLEITESASLQAKHNLLANMEKLIDYGVHFSLDDFGTGESNLNYIVDMPVSIVKFDRGMIQAYFASGKAKYVMDAAMHMIQGMDLEMVAEGIETEEQYKKMEEISIDYIQGYYFSKPLPENEFLEFLKEKNKIA